MRQHKARPETLVLAFLVLLAGCQWPLGATWSPPPEYGGEHTTGIDLREHLFAIANRSWPPSPAGEDQRRPLGALADGTKILGPGEEAERWRMAYYDHRLRSSTVGIYTGRGAEPVFWRAIAAFCDDHHISWERFDETELGTLNQRFDAVWFGGGFSSQYRIGILEHQLLREFVEGGGSFLGICAGAYYAANTMRWHGGMTDYPLNLFDGDAIGPLPNVSWGQSTTIALNPGHLANQRSEAALIVYYMDGPYFAWQEHPKIETIATYDVNDKPAVISFTYGQGRVLLIGPHPEMGYDQTRREFTTDGSHGGHWPWLRELVQYALYQ